MVDGKTLTGDASLASGESRSEMSANLLCRVPGEPLDAKRIAGHLTFHLASISDFIRQNQVEGILNADGDLRFDHLQPEGTVRSSGSQLKYRGMILQSLGLDAVFKDVGSRNSEFSNWIRSR